MVKLHFQITAMHHTTIQATHAVSGSQQNAVKILNLYQYPIVVTNFPAMQTTKYAQCTFRCFVGAHSVLATSWFLSACEEKLKKVVKSTLSVLLSIVTKK